MQGFLQETGFVLGIGWGLLDRFVEQEMSEWAVGICDWSMVLGLLEILLVTFVGFLVDLSRWLIE